MPGVRAAPGGMRIMKTANWRPLLLGGMRGAAVRQPYPRSRPRSVPRTIQTTSDEQSHEKHLLKCETQPSEKAHTNAQHYENQPMLRCWSRGCRLVFNPLYERASSAAAAFCADFHRSTWHLRWQTVSG